MSSTRRKIKVKRIYQEPAQDDGRRILVDRLWPRGVSKEKAKVDFWAKEISPTDELRKWYNHDPEKWSEFRRRYFAELDNNTDAVQKLRDEMTQDVVTFLFSSKELKLNNAYALKEHLENLQDT